MRFEVVSESIIRKAIQSYLDIAWGDLAASHMPSINFESGDRDVVLDRFARESQGGCMRKFTLRLGNRRYPFMKLVFQELLVRDSFFFSVDTHDELDIKSTTPDYAEWLAIREYNANVKEHVEREWREKGIPTFDDVMEAVESDEIPDDQKRTDGTSPLIFVVDDDVAIADGVSIILQKRGYLTEVFHCAEEALEKLDHQRPDLILSDLEMGSGYTGLQFCRKMRQKSGCGDIPFLLATAASIDLVEHDLIDGFLVKPFEIDVLITFIANHLP